MEAVALIVLLIVFPLSLFAACALGAWIYHRGRGGLSPLPPLPSISKRQAMQTSGEPAAGDKKPSLRA